MLDEVGRAEEGIVIEPVMSPLESALPRLDSDVTAPGGSVVDVVELVDGGAVEVVEVVEDVLDDVVLEDVVLEVVVLAPGNVDDVVVDVLGACPDAET